MDQIQDAMAVDAQTLGSRLDVEGVLKFPLEATRRNHEAPGLPSGRDVPPDADGH